MAGNHGKSWPRSQLPLHRRSLWRCRLSKKCNEEFTASPYKTPENQALAVKKSSSNFALRKSAIITIEQAFPKELGVVAVKGYIDVFRSGLESWNPGHVPKHPVTFEARLKTEDSTPTADKAKIQAK